MTKKLERQPTIILKVSSDLKNAVRLAAVNSGKSDSSKFVRELLEKNKDVKKYIKTN